MASGAVPDGVLRIVFEGCISGYDNCIERRPYHRNCGCALHNKSGNKNCSHKVPRCDKVSYPMRRSWSEGSLLVLAPTSDSAHFSSSSSFNSSPASAGCRSQLNLVKLDEEEENNY